MFFFVVFSRTFVITHLQQWMIWIIYVWSGAVIVAALTFFALDIIRASSWLIDKVLKTGVCNLYTPWRRGVAGIVLSFLLCVYGYWQAQNVQPVHITVHTDKMASGSGLRVAAISDLHLGNFIGEKKLEKIAGIVIKANPDIFVFVGDIVDADMSGRMEEAAIIKKITPHGGGFAVLGNHEAFRGTEQAIAFLEYGGLRVLRNEAVEALEITIVGVDDPFFGITVEQEIDLLQRLDPSNFILFLRHRPGYRLEKSGLYDLQLAGHTHGGQIWPASIVAARVNKVSQGVTHKSGDGGKSILYTMDGAGFWGPPIRIGTSPEILVVDIVGTGKIETAAIE
jgi:predicted MPP superfamily phosphohydrolase